jgi:hypothetical protein
MHGTAALANAPDPFQNAWPLVEKWLNEFLCQRPSIQLLYSTKSPSLSDPGGRIPIIFPDPACCRRRAIVCSFRIPSSMDERSRSAYCRGVTAKRPSLTSAQSTIPSLARQQERELHRLDPHAPTNYTPRARVRQYSTTAAAARSLRRSCGPRMPCK